MGADEVDESAPGLLDLAHGKLAEIAARRGVPVDTLLDGPSRLHPDRWAQSPEEHRAMLLEMAEQGLRNVARGEFALERLPQAHPHTARWIKQHIADPDVAPWLVLRGVPGCGKTSQLFVVLRELALHYARLGQVFRWYFITHRDFAAETRPGGDAPPEQVMKKYEDAHFLAFSDLGDFNDKDWAVDCTVRLINHRYHHRLPTVYETNLPFNRTPALIEREQREQVRIATLSDTLDGRVLSRLKAGWIAVLPEIDHRARQGRVFGK